MDLWSPKRAGDAPPDEVPGAMQGTQQREIIYALHQVQDSERVGEFYRRLGVSELTFYRWKDQFAGLGLASRLQSRAPYSVLQDRTPVEMDTLVGHVGRILSKPRLQVAS